jgi:glucose-6-phosphate dehydrogenase assembly protein OpcA
VSSTDERLLPGAIEMPFADIVAALTTGRDPAIRSCPARTLAATLVAVCSSQRVADAAVALQSLGKHTAVRIILISEGTQTKPRAFVAEDSVAVPGLNGAFVNNAVAALRLSSLPTIVWWRGCSPGMLEDLADLADRMILDDQEPLGVWRRAADLFERSTFSDLRWTRLTRWRALMAHFFDNPEIRDRSARFDRLEITGSDPVAAGLFAAWLSAGLTRETPINVRFDKSRRDVFLETVRLLAPDEELKLQLTESGTCVLTSAAVQGHRGAIRTVALGDQSDAALLTEELRIRVRDLSFERALLACLAAPSS